MDIEVRQPAEGDRDSWYALFLGYQKFYRARVPDDIIDHTWKRILDPACEVHGLVAERHGELIGLTHYLYHQSTWSNRRSCYLEDLFVGPQARGTGAAKLLIRGVEAAARRDGAFRLYWHTQQYNGPARSLYDTLAPPSSFMVYRKSLD